MKTILEKATNRPNFSIVINLGQVDRFNYSPLSIPICKSIIYPFESLWIEYSIGKIQYGISSVSLGIENNHSKFARFIGVASRIGKCSQNLVLTNPLPEIATISLLHISQFKEDNMLQVASWLFLYSDHPHNIKSDLKVFKPFRETLEFLRNEDEVRNLFSPLIWISAIIEKFGKKSVARANLNFHNVCKILEGRE